MFLILRLSDGWVLVFISLSLINLLISEFLPCVKSMYSFSALKTISEISGTTKKPFKQKGTGSARQGSLRSAQMRGGSTIFGPVVRSHAIDLTKKFRKLALKTALSAKQAEGTLFILDSADVKGAKTKELAAQFKKIGWDKPLIIDGETLNETFAKAARNIKHVDVLPTQGANVVDILRHKQLVLTKAAVAKLEERLK